MPSFALFPHHSPYLCFAPFQSFPSELALSPLCLPWVPHQSPPPTKCSAPAHAFCFLSRNPPCPCSAPLCSFPSPPAPLSHDAVFLPTSMREPTSYQLLLEGHLSVGCQQPKPSCSYNPPHHCTVGQPLRPAHSPRGHFPGLFSSRISELIWFHPTASHARSMWRHKRWPEAPRGAGEEKWDSPFCQHCSIRVAKQDHAQHPRTNHWQGDAIWLLWAAWWLSQVFCLAGRGSDIFLSEQHYQGTSKRCSLEVIMLKSTIRRKKCALWLRRHEVQCQQQ